MSAVSSRNTKAEILKAYNALLKDHQNLQKNYQSLSNQKSAPAAAPKAAAPKKVVVKAGAAPSSVAEIIAGISSLRSGVGDSTGTLQSKLTAEATKLAEIREEAAGHIADITGLHGIELSENTLVELIEQHDAESTKFDEELAAKKTALSDELSEKKDAWKKEQDENRRVTRERDDELKKARKREAAEFKYDLDLKRNLEKDAYAQKKKDLQQELDDLTEAKNNAWKEREETISEQEKEYADLKKKVDAFPKEKESAVKKAKEEGVGIAKRQAKITASLIKKKNEDKERVYKLRISSLEEAIAKQNAQITDLSQKLSTAQRQAQELAVKAIEGASNERSFLAVKEIALEQAKTPQKGK